MSGPNLQRTFDFPRAAKLNALERVEYLGNVKGALKALDAFARDAASCTVTMKMIARSMGKSINTARRAIRAAVEANLLRVSGQCTDGCSNTYTVNWSVVFSLPDGVRKQKRKSTQTPTKPALVPPPNLGGDPSQLGRGPLPSWEGCQTPTLPTKKPTPNESQKRQRTAAEN